MRRSGNRTVPHGQNKFPFSTWNQQMAGVKGKSGGPRKNAGGARPGAGRKPKAKAGKSANGAGPQATVELEAQPHGGALKRSHAQEIDPAEALMDGTKREPLEFLELVLNLPEAPLKDRIRAAIAAAQYRHMKKGDGGKKEEADAKAKKAASGRFAPKAPPRLVAAGGKPV
jgi:phage terminase small subunit